jgi:hypothetical protein
MKGICNICACTDEEGCAEGCAWADREHTLCTACKSLSITERAAKRDEVRGELQMRHETLVDKLLMLRERLRVLDAEPAPSMPKKRSQAQQPYPKARR